MPRVFTQQPVGRFDLLQSIQIGIRCIIFTVVSDYDGRRVNYPGLQFPDKIYFTLGLQFLDKIYLILGLQFLDRIYLILGLQLPDKIYLIDG